jgi:hypothetical protein
MPRRTSVAISMLFSMLAASAVCFGFTRWALACNELYSDEVWCGPECPFPESRTASRYVECCNDGYAETGYDMRTYCSSCGGLELPDYYGLWPCSD